MDLKNKIEIVNFLKSYSNVFDDRGKEFVLHCPYCDDSLRTNARSHGHLYISRYEPVFHCFRCNTSGHLGTLLRHLGFSNNELLSSLGSPKYIKSYERTLLKNQEEYNIYESIRKKNFNYRNGQPNDFYKVERYISSRLGEMCDLNRYLITPEIRDKKIVAAFYNSDGKYTTGRFIDNNNLRYHREEHISEFYYFQTLDFDKYSNIVLTEGPFDCLKLYRFSDKFPKDETFYMSVLGKNYGKAINWLISSHIPIGKYIFNLVFDNDNKSMRKFISLGRKIANRINEKILVKGYKPLLGKDAGEYPFLEEC